MAQNPNPSLLDPGQIIKRSFDSTNDAIRVDASISVSPGALSINSVDDSISLGDTSGNLVHVENNALKVAITDENGDAYSQANPLDVRISDDTAGTAVFDYKTVTNLAANTSNDHTYLVIGNTFRLKSVFGSASGLIKIDVLVGPVGSEITYFTFFNGGSGNPQLTEELPEDFNIPVGQNVILRVLNREVDPMNVYSTIVGEVLV